MREHGFSEQSFYRWKSKYGGLEDDRRIKGSNGWVGEVLGCWAVGDLWFERWPLSHILCFAAPAHPCAMDTGEPMDTDEP